jgi:hypothetical protein
MNNMGNLQSVKMMESLARETYSQFLNSRIKKEQKSLTDFQLQAPDLEETKEASKAKAPEDTYVPAPKPDPAPDFKAV